jgi:hypothetical protein
MFVTVLYSLAEIPIGEDVISVKNMMIRVTSTRVKIVVFTIVNASQIIKNADISSRRYDPQ